jgi:hypothetical protein
MRPCSPRSSASGAAASLDQLKSGNLVPFKAIREVDKGLVTDFVAKR